VNDPEEFWDPVINREMFDIRRVMPLYRGVNCKLKYKWDFPVKLGDHYETCIVKYDSDSKDVPTYFICNERYFNRDSIYGYYDDGERYLFFCRAVIKMLEFMPFKPDIIHCNDWHTGIIPLLVKSQRLDIKTLYTIHNIKYQGAIGGDYIKDEAEDMEETAVIGYPEMINFMKSGILFSDYISAPSPSYAQEILTPQYGEGMEEILSQRKDKLYGILNGIDALKYDPENGDDLEFPFSSKDLSQKIKNKNLLKQELGLKTEGTDNVPLIVSITRLDEQKGIDLIIQALENIKSDFQYIIMGSGNMYYERILGYLSKAYPGKIVFMDNYDEALAKKIYAAGDIYLMPSKYEPGGLSQLYAMRYGCVPVVRNTGGLRDTVTDYSSNKKNGNGFSFEKYTLNSFVDTINNAIEVYNTDNWDKLVKNAMRKDWSWKKSALEYERLYGEMTQRL
jgi:starch synthase